MAGPFPFEAQWMVRNHSGWETHDGSGISISTKDYDLKINGLGTVMWQAVHAQACG